MTNAMTTALVSAGFPPITLAKRIWLWLHDHPNKTTKEIAVAINEAPANVASRLSDMVARGMVMRANTRRSLAISGPRRLIEYAVATKEYEILPVKKSAMPISRVAISAIEKVAPGAELKEASKPKNIQAVGDTLRIDRMIPAATAEPTDPPPLRINVKALPLGEALRVYGELHAVFGPQA